MLQMGFRAARIRVRCARQQDHAEDRVMNDEDLLEGEDKSSKFKARIHDFYMKVRCAGCGTFGAHASRKCNGTWIVKLVHVYVVRRIRAC